MQSDGLALSSKDIRKSFGQFAALNGITLHVKRGDFLTLFGRNGAGKTTFLKIAASLMRPTAGSLSIEGHDIREEPEKARRNIGFLSHNTYVYRDLTPTENLQFFSRLYGVANADKRIGELLERVGLRRRAHDPVRTFSRGLQQRLGLARAILHDPRLILLDEPYTGLDANAVVTLNEILDETIQRGNTVILTTHDLEQGLRAATRVVIIDRGAVAFDETSPGNDARTAYEKHVRTGDPR